MAVVTMTSEGLPAAIHWAHILPGASESTPYRIMDPIPPFRPEVGCLDLILALEAELTRKKTDAAGPAGSEQRPAGQCLYRPAKRGPGFAG
jgi:hypothetical protein